MPLLVVPLAVQDAELLTLAEWDALRACTRVLFERVDHPLAARLAAAGVATEELDGDPDAGLDSVAFVCDPDSLRILELARSGADVSAGPAHPPDSLSAAHAAPVLRRASAALATLTVVMARLRSDDGCPWDREQTHESLKVHLLEESHEVLEAIDEHALGPELAEELGDVLLQVAFHARIAEQEGRFDVADVADTLVAKLIHRHPHVFGDLSVEDADEVVRNWEAIKGREKDRPGPFSDIPKGLPALLAAYKTQKRAARLGWSADENRTRRGVETALEEGELGEALFWLVALARASGIDPEGALLSATARFRESLDPS
jgi:uncharacterized protein YabN with tetrapyrrole methylase and pyrophosphatase domain